MNARATPATDPGAAVWETVTPSRHRRAESTTLLGYGDEMWERATHDALHWRIKTRSGFTVDDSGGVGEGEAVTITAGPRWMRVREPVEVVRVVREQNRVGFSYRTLPGHPVSGEEAFILHREAGAVFLTIRSLTAPASRGMWRPLFPILLVAQRIVRRRYRRALR